MTEYLNIGKKAQKRLIRELKDNCTLSWTGLAKELQVTRGMVLFYQSGRCRIPKDKLEKTIQLSKMKLDIHTLPFVKGNYSLQKVILPPMSENLAEFLGILYGDGCLGNYGYLIDICGDSKADFLYHTTRIKPLLCVLFGLEPRLWFDKDKQGMHTRLTAKAVHSHISNSFSFPIGEKKGRMSIPNEIYENDNYKRAFIRGLFDTDGGVHRHHLHSVQVHYTSLDPKFLHLVWKLFRELGFNAKLGEEDIWIFDRSHVIRFFDEVKPANPKHLYKFKQYLETGIVPRHRDIDYDKLNAGAGN